VGNKIGPIYKSPVSASIPYDDTIQTPLSGTDDVQEMLDWLKNQVAISASPGFTWGRSGTVNQNTWLLNDSVPSNLSGRVCFLNSASIIKVFVANQAATAGIVVEVYTHDGNSVNLTLIGSVTTLATRSNTFTVAYPVSLDKQIAIKIANGSPSGANMVVGCLIKGSTA
jgi:hypothetical protein